MPVEPLHKISYFTSGGLSWRLDWNIVTESQACRPTPNFTRCLMRPTIPILTVRIRTLGEFLSDKALRSPARLPLQQKRNNELAAMTSLAAKYGTGLVFTFQGSPRRVDMGLVITPRTQCLSSGTQEVVGLPLSHMGHRPQSPTRLARLRAKATDKQQEICK